MISVFSTNVMNAAVVCIVKNRRRAISSPKYSFAPYVGSGLIPKPEGFITEYTQMLFIRQKAGGKSMWSDFSRNNLASFELYISRREHCP